MSRCRRAEESIFFYSQQILLTFLKDTRPSALTWKEVTFAGCLESLKSLTKTAAVGEPLPDRRTRRCASKGSVSKPKKTWLWRLPTACLQILVPLAVSHKTRQLGQCKERRRCPEFSNLPSSQDRSSTEATDVCAKKERGFFNNLTNGYSIGAIQVEPGSNCCHWSGCLEASP